MYARPRIGVSVSAWKNASVFQWESRWTPLKRWRRALGSHDRVTNAHEDKAFALSCDHPADDLKMTSPILSMIRSHTSGGRMGVSILWQA